MASAKTVKIEELVAVLGEKRAVALCRYFGGRRLPTIDKFLRARRNLAMWRDYHEGWTLPDLSAKYNLPEHVVRRTLTAIARQERPGKQGAPPLLADEDTNLNR